MNSSGSIKACLSYTWRRKLKCILSGRDKLAALF
jgi:hypothetical protein